MSPFLKRILYSVSLLVLLLLITEIGFRILGYEPFPTNISTEISKPSNYGGFHPVYGFYPYPGKYDVTVNNGLYFKVTHNSDSSRITRPYNDTTNYEGKPILNIYGCSITWGAGINDSSTYAYLIQKGLPEYNVQNKGVFVGGNIQAYLLLREEIKSNKTPTIALISYGSFHDQRNTWSRYWATLIKQAILNNAKNNSSGKNGIKEISSKLKSYAFPKARIINDSLKIIYSPLKGDLFPFSQYSSLCNRVNNVLMNLDESRIKSHQVTKSLFLEISELCKKNNVRLIVMCMDEDALTTDMQEYFNQVGIESFTAGVDYVNNNNFNLMPYDGHPNEKANKIYAEKFISYLKRSIK